MPIDDNARREIDERASRNWEKLKAQHKHTWHLYSEIGEAMIAARNRFMKANSVNKPEGPGYQQDMKAWLVERGLDDMDKGVRSHLMWLTDRAPAVATWYAGLSPAQQHEWNHPNTVWRAYKKHEAAEERPPRETKIPDVSAAKLTAAELVKQRPDAGLVVPAEEAQAIVAHYGTIDAIKIFDAGHKLIEAQAAKDPDVAVLAALREDGLDLADDAADELDMLKDKCRELYCEFEELIEDIKSGKIRSGKYAEAIRTILDGWPVADVDDGEGA